MLRAKELIIEEGERPNTLAPNLPYFVNFKEILPTSSLPVSECYPQ